MSAIVINLHIRTTVIAPWRTFRNVRNYIINWVDEGNGRRERADT